MSAAAFIAFLGFYAVPWMVAGLIHPAAAGLAGASRRHIIGVAAAFLFACIVVAKIITSPAPEHATPASSGETAMVLLWMLAMLVWPAVAILGRFMSKRKRGAAQAPFRSQTLGPPQPAKPAESITKKPEMPAIKPSRAIRTGWSIGIVAFTYQDSAGEISYRTVTVHSVSPAYLKGECHDRQAERTFRVDRIIGDLADVETGEITEPMVWVEKYA